MGDIYDGVFFGFFLGGGGSKFLFYFKFFWMLILGWLMPGVLGVERASFCKMISCSGRNDLTDKI